MIIRAFPAARRLAKERGIDLSTVTGSGPGGSVLRKDVHAVLDRPAQRTAEIGAWGALRPTTLAQKLAQREGVSIDAASGSGPGGRVFLRDVSAAIEHRARPAGPKGPSAGIQLGQTYPMSRVRRIIAKRMSESASTAPHIYFFAEVEMGRLLALREEILPEFEGAFGVRPSLNDFIVKAVGLTLGEYPLLNASVHGDEIRVHPEINVGLAVALEEGIIVPAIPAVDRLGLGQIARMRADLVARARAGKLSMEEMERGTFTVSSLAQFDVAYFTAIINPPQSGILSVGKLDEKLVLVDGQVQVRRVSCFGLSVDHRIIDGVLAATFLQALKRKLEIPAYAFLQV